MPLSENDYRKLYNFQDLFLEQWCNLDLPFYLTGGTALGRFYLNHRYSDDLDFFINNSDKFKQYIQYIRDFIKHNFNTHNDHLLITDDYARFFVHLDNQILKIEFINDVEYYVGSSEEIYFGYIDTPVNILSNKLNTLISRDEPKDVYDIIMIALNFSFSWKEVFLHAKEKAVLNEIDIERRLVTFPVELISNVKWLMEEPDLNEVRKHLSIIANDFLYGFDNSLGKNMPSIELAKPVLYK